MSRIPAATQQPPTGQFVYVDEVVDGAQVDLHYAQTHNFTGAVVPGYAGRRAIMTRRAAQALAHVQEAARERGVGLLIWDTYRPQRAVDAFVGWRGQACDAAIKRAYYPTYTKEQLFELGLIASPSAHSRGSTVDLSLVALSGAGGAGGAESGRDALPGAPLDMGTAFDFFSPLSATGCTGLTPLQRGNRALLLALMTDGGFENMPSEWWHYTLRDEPFPHACFDFEVRDDWAL